jgi:hypothetical protein
MLGGDTTKEVRLPAGFVEGGAGQIDPMPPEATPYSVTGWSEISQSLPLKIEM